MLDRLRQQGCAKIRLPRVHKPGHPEAVLLNTAGGLTGGDRFDVDASWAPGTQAAVTTQAAERLYKSTGGQALVCNRLHVGAGAVAFWLPQETIAFDGAAIERRFEVELEGDATLFAVESWMIGRAAMGETVQHAEIRDHWRVRRDGKLVFADGLRLSGDVQSILDRPAIARGRSFFATLFVSPFDDTQLDEIRELCTEADGEAGCSAFANALVARLVTQDVASLRQAIIQIISRLGSKRLDGPFAMPRVWNC